MAQTSGDGDADEQAERRSRNESLVTLASVFPDVRPDVFRELLLSFSGESRLYLVAEALLMNKSRVVHGRWRSLQQSPEAGEDGASPTPPGQPQIAGHELFRSEGYKSAVKAAFYAEFPSLSHSAIKGVLAERNCSYTETRPLLFQLNSQSWRVSFTNLFYRRKLPSPLNHPLVAWVPGINASINDPVLRSTASSELNKELHEALIEPVRRERLDEQILQDVALAEALNEEEAEAVSATYDCECCFMPNTFERISLCSKNHYLCFRCLRHTISEALYGQGWAQSIDEGRCTIRCIAPSSPGKDACTGFVPQYLARRAVMTEKGSLEMWHKFEARLVSNAIPSKDITVIKCPFCVYAVIDTRLGGWSWETSVFIMVCFSLICLTFMVVPLRLVDASQLVITLGWLAATAAIITTIVLIIWTTLSAAGLIGPMSAHRAPVPDKTDKGRKFLCRNPSCLTPSCLDCRAAWTDPHACHPTLTLSLRTHVEAALTAHTKRTCPLCNLSFIKSSGCNKLECPCGYRMCYLCRQDVRAEGYAHFCGHFRPDALGACPVECGRCDLYRDEVEEGGLEGVRRRAEEEWWVREGARKGAEQVRRRMSESGRGSVGGGGAGGVRAGLAKRRRPWG